MDGVDGGIVTLAALLRELAARGLRIRVHDGAARLHGGRNLVDAPLRAAIAQHRPNLLRLHRASWSPRAARAGWRRQLAEADPDTREAWALFAQGGEDHGLHPAAAEWWAWHRVAP